MIESRDWNAVITGDGRVRVSGVCVVPTSGWGAELRRHEPQESEAELLLDLVLERPTGPVLQVISAVPVAYEDASGNRYERVSILPDGPHRLPVQAAPAQVR